MTNKLYKVEGKEITHLKLNGGKLSIPENKITKFRKLYAKDVENEFQDYVCEMKTKNYKLFVDVDLLDNEALTDDLILKYARLINEVVVHYYKHLEPKVIVCTTTPKPVNVNDYNYIKTGIHLIWDNIIVSSENIGWLREAIIQYLQLKVGDTQFESWEKIIDDSVYKQNGLRMIYSNKMAFCKVCKKSETCSLCNKTGKYHEGRPYTPFKTIDASGKVEECKWGILETINKTSIVTTESVSKFIHKHPEWMEGESPGKFKHTKRELSSEDLEASNRLKFRERITKDSEIFKSIQNFVRKIFPNFKNVTIVDMHKCANGDYYVCRSNSSYCMNIDREHQSNTIYFYIDKHNIYQKCFCSCDTVDGRKYGMCKDYRSSGYKLTKVLTGMLYPHDDIDTGALCELNTMNDLKKNKVGYVSNLQIYLGYLESEILNKKKNEM